VLKYWGVARKKVYGDVYEAHGTCTETVTMDPGCALIEQTTHKGGDGYKGTRVLGGYDVEVAATSRSTGSCSQLCKSTAKCNYWVVHNTKGCLMHENVKAASFKAAWKPKGYLAHGTCNGYAAPGPPGSSSAGRVADESDPIEVDVDDAKPADGSFAQASAIGVAIALALGTIVAFVTHRRTAADATVVAVVEDDSTDLAWDEAGLPSVV